MSTKVDELLTLGEVAERFGTQLWKVGRVFERGLLPDPPRVGKNRVVTEKDIPAIEKAMREAGYLE